MKLCGMVAEIASENAEKMVYVLKDPSVKSALEPEEHQDLQRALAGLMGHWSRSVVESWKGGPADAPASLTVVAYGSRIDFLS